MSIKILVVEDEIIVAIDIKNRLTKLGYTVTAITYSGEEAINNAAEDRPDLVLMDINLKGNIDGVEAAAQIINRFNIGGITYNVSYLSKYLEPDYETLLVGGPEEEGEDSSLYIPEGLGLKPKVLNQFQREINLKADYAAYKEIKKIIREFKPDIVHTHASKAGAIGRLAAIHCKVPL